MREPKNQMLGTMKPPLMQLSVKILKAYGIQEIVRAINFMYSNTQVVVLSPDGETDAFEILEVGVLQEDILAPYLFIFVVDYVMRVAIGNDEDLVGFTVTPRKIGDILQK